jgi:hypothetical protein
LPNSEDFILAGRMKEINLAYINGFFFPMTPQEHSDPAMTYDLSSVQRAMESWDSDYAENVETHKGNPTFMDKYGNMIMLGMVLMTQFIFLIIILTQLKGGAGNAVSAVQQVIK